MKTIDFIHELYFICNSAWDNSVKDAAIKALTEYVKAWYGIRPIITSSLYQTGIDEETI